MIIDQVIKFDESEVIMRLYFEYLMDLILRFEMSLLPL